MSKSTAREKLNAYIHLTYVRKDFAECQKAIEQQLMATNLQSEYPLYVKGIQHSLTFVYSYIAHTH